MLDIHGTDFKSTDDVTAHYNYFNKLLNELKFAYSQGMSLEETKNKLSLDSSFIDFKDLLNSSENHPKNIESIWKLLDKD